MYRRHWLWRAFFLVVPLVHGHCCRPIAQAEAPTATACEIALAKPVQLDVREQPLEEEVDRLRIIVAQEAAKMCMAGGDPTELTEFMMSCIDHAAWNESDAEVSPSCAPLFRSQTQERYERAEDLIEQMRRLQILMKKQSFFYPFAGPDLIHAEEWTSRGDL